MSLTHTQNSPPTIHIYHPAHTHLPLVLVSSSHSFCYFLLPGCAGCAYPHPRGATKPACSSRLLLPSFFVHPFLISCSGTHTPTCCCSVVLVLWVAGPLRSATTPGCLVVCFFYFSFLYTQSRLWVIIGTLILFLIWLIRVRADIVLDRTHICT